MTLRCYVIFLMILLCCSVVFVSADQYSDEEAVYRFLEEIVSSVSKYDQHIDQTPAMITVITEEQIKNIGAEILPDILKTIPGVEVHRTLGGFYNIAFRGIRGTANVLFMIDGHRVNSFYDGVSMYNISAENIRRIEIIRGPGSSMHGSNAFVGVINVITKKYTEGATVSVLTDRNNGVRASIGYGYDLTNYDLSLFAELYKTEGHEVSYVVDRSKEPGFMDDENQQLNLNLSVSNDDGFVLSTKLLKEDRGAYLGENYFADNEQYYKQEMIMFDYSNSYELNNQSKIITKLYTDISEINKLINMGWNERAGLGRIPGYAKIDYKSQAMGAELQYFHQFSEKNTFIVGMIYETMRLYDYSFKTNYKMIHQSGEFRTNIPVDAIQNPDHLNLPFADYHTIFTQSSGTYRADLVSQNDYAQNNNRRIMGFFLQNEYNYNRFLGITFGARYDNYSDFGSTFNPKAGVVSNPVDSLIIKLAYATAFRAPTFQEMYDRTQIGVKNGVFGNPYLDAETIKTIELGAEYKLSEMVKIGLNVYNNDIKDNIFPNNSSKTNGPIFKASEDDPGDFYENINGIKVKGLESMFRYDFDRTNYFHLNYSWFRHQNLGGLRPQSQSAYVTDYKSYITSQPQARINAQLNFDFAGLSRFADYLENCPEYLSKGLVFNFKYHYGSKRMNDVIDLTESNRSYSNGDGRRWRIPAYNVLDLSVRTTDYLWENNTITFSVKNITNEKLYDDYTDALPFSTGWENFTENLIMPLPGRSFYIKVVSKF